MGCSVDFGLGATVELQKYHASGTFPQPRLSTSETNYSCKTKVREREVSQPSYMSGSRV